MRKQRAELLIFSRLDYCYILLDNIPTHVKNQLRKVQNAAAGFVSNKSAQIKDVLELKLLTIEENIKTDIFVQSFT